MATCNKLYDFLVSKATEISEEWYEGLDKLSTGGVYTSTNPEEIEFLKEENKQFHLRFFQVFIKEEEEFLQNLEDWITKIAKDDGHLNTPANFILNEFYRTRNIYLKKVKDFVALHDGEFSQTEIDEWNQTIISTLDKVTVWFLEEYDTYFVERLQSHQEIINELSSPVIKITDTTGLLPLVGDIDTIRAKHILEETLQQCADKKLDYLFIDLSGVAMVDTMVAQQIFLLHESLSLIGVEATLCGIRPEIAQTAVQLGLSFEKIPVSSTLERALQHIFH